MNRRILPLILIGALSASVLAGCANTPEAPDASASASTSASSAPEPSIEPTVVPSVDPADVTCEQLLPSETLDVFESVGWTVKIDPFRIGSTELPDGLWCTWGDFDEDASALAQIYGWSPIDAGQATTAQDELIAEGWVREDGPSGVYITENPDTAVSTDDAGYGMTYLFGDGWVTVSDTKEGLLVIEVP